MTKTKLILILILAMVVGFLLRDLIDGANIFGFVLIREEIINSKDFTEDGYNPMRDIKFKEVGK